MNKTQYLLSKLAEECNEVAQMALKCQQFGLDEVYVDRDNRDRLIGELDDLMGTISALNDIGFGYSTCDRAVKAKKVKIEHYLSYSRGLGMTEEETPNEPVADDGLPLRKWREC